MPLSFRVFANFGCPQKQQLSLVCKLHDCYTFACQSCQANYLADTIAGIRTEFLSFITDILRDMMEKLFVMDQSPRWSRYTAQPSLPRCRHVTYESVQSSLKAVNMWPLSEATAMRESAVEFYSKLAVVVHHGHRDCEFANFWAGKVQHVLKSRPVVLTRLYRQFRSN